jgi:hypothetical protein
MNRTHVYIFGAELWEDNWNTFLPMYSRLVRRETETDKGHGNAKLFLFLSITWLINSNSIWSMNCIDQHRMSTMSTFDKDTFMGMPMASQVQPR